MKKIIAAFVMGSVLMAFAAVVQAQVLGQANNTVEKPTSIKLGILLPTNSSDRNNAGNTQFSAGLDYAFEKTGSDSPSLPSVYADYSGGSKSGGHATTIGAGVAIRSYTPMSTGSNHSGVSPYFGVGAGIYNVNVKNNADTPSQSGNTTTIGGKVFAGLEMNSGIFLEANYQQLPSTKGVNPSGIGVQLGARF